MLTTLSPYTRYNLVPRACTVGGCTDSRAVQIITMSAAPEGQQPPNITALSSSELYVTWQPPLFPNGMTFKGSLPISFIIDKIIIY